ncbi:hypothetical protein C7B65_22340, partial [Phormidesmis priestleyi ULC007]
MKTQPWQMAVAIGLGMSGAIVISILPAVAQSVIVPDETLGNERSVVLPLDANGFPVDAIIGGAQRGQNLFHSFREFNVSAGRGAYFFNPDATIQNILARVTGSNASTILGTLGTFGQGSPNLFLINPNGMIFGANASLNVQGSFVATTANGVKFGDRGIFSATQPEIPSALLTIDPSAFLFNQIPAGNIVVQANQPISPDSDTLGLQVPNGESLLLLGGNVTIDGGQLNAWGGRVELGGLAKPGIIGLNENWSLRFPDGIARSDVSVTNQAFIDVQAANGGNISIYAHNLGISRNSYLFAGIREALGNQESQAGDIILDAIGEIQVRDRSFVSNFIDTGSTGNGGNINIVADSWEHPTFAMSIHTQCQPRHSIGQSNRS